MKFLDELKKARSAGRIPLIPDIKCYSPKDGELMKGRDPVLIAKQLESAGACAFSVVTEEKEFHGSMELLKRVCECVSVPVLRKDFVTCEADLDETKAAGADAILLMVSCLGEEKLEPLYYAAIARGLTPFVETHTEKELQFALRLGAPLVGINNRDITVLERDDGTVEHSENILRQAKQGMAAEHDGGQPFIIVESALRDGDDVRSALRSGADGVLVGTAILNASDPVKKYLSMTRKCGMKICGLMSEADVDACLAENVDICGFVVNYPVPVRWNLDEETARRLIDRVKQYRPDVNNGSCIVTGGDPEEVVRLALNLHPDLLQLHYKESFDQTVKIAAMLKKEGIGVIRSIPMDSDALEEMFGTRDLLKILQMLADSDVAGILFDSRNAQNAASGGGDILNKMEAASGVISDEDASGADDKINMALKDALKLLIDSGKLVMAGGGITAENAGQVMKALQPDYLDIMTGAENADGNKSAEIIRKLILTTY